MKKIFIILFLLAMTLVSAQFIEDLPEIQKEMVGQTLPGPMGALFGDERMNIHLSGEEGKVVTMITDKKVVKEFEFGLLEDATLNVYTTEQVLDQVVEADDTIEALQLALDNGGITYEAVGVGKKIKFGISKLFVKIAGWFS